MSSEVFAFFSSFVLMRSASKPALQPPSPRWTSNLQFALPLHPRPSAHTLPAHPFLQILLPGFPSQPLPSSCPSSQVPRQIPHLSSCMHQGPLAEEVVELWHPRRKFLYLRCRKEDL